VLLWESAAALRTDRSKTLCAFATSRSPLSSSLGIWTSVRRPLKAGHTTRAANGPPFQAPIINGWVFSSPDKRGCLLIQSVPGPKKIEQNFVLPGADLHRFFRLRRKHTDRSRRCTYKQSMDTRDIIVTPVNVLVTFVPPMGAIRCLLLACGLRYEMRSFVFVCKVLSSQTLRGVIVVLLCITWGYGSTGTKFCSAFFTRSLRPPPASQRRGSRQRCYARENGRFRRPSQGRSQASSWF
jgi:hypothetical protein